VLGDFEGQRLRAATFLTLVEGNVHGERVVQLGHGLDGELHVDHGAGDSGYSPYSGGGLSCCGHLVAFPSSFRVMWS